MKKKLFLSWLLFGSLAWNSSGVSAQVYEADRETPLITNVSADASETQLSSNCTWVVTDPNNDNMQPENNYDFYSEGNYLGTLIDGSLATYWHSDPGRNYANEDQWIQVDLKRSDVDKFYFMIHRREDPYNGSIRHGMMPRSFEIQVSNSPSDAKSWTTVTTISDLPHQDAEDAFWPYYSSLINMGGKYRHVRFICRQSGAAYWCFSEFQMYPAKEVTDPKSKLQILVDSIQNLNRNYETGADPGCYNQQKYDVFQTIFEEANRALSTSASADEYDTYSSKVRVAFAELNNSALPVVEGYYRIVSGYAPFSGIQGYEKALTVDLTTQRLSWSNLDEENGGEIFKITALEDGNWSIQNIVSELYIGSVEGDATVSTVYVPMTKEQEVAQVITPFGKGSATFSLSNVNNSRDYHCLGHDNGQGISGFIVPAATGPGTPITWYLRSVSEEEAKQLMEEGKKETMAHYLKLAIEEAEKLRYTTNDYEALIFEANDEDDEHNQFSSNARWTYLDKATGGQGSYAALIDGSSDTYFHSVATSSPNAYHYLQVDLKRTDISSFTFKMLRRGDAGWPNNWNQLPNNIAIYATNDASIVNDPTPSDYVESGWVKIQELTSGFPSVSSHDYYTSPTIAMGQAYQYVRFVVRSTLAGGNDTGGLPYFNMSEFQMYNTVPTATSEYYTVEGMKEACDKLDALMAEGKKKIDELTVTAEDTAAIYECMRTIQNLYVDRQAISTELTKRLELAKSTYKSAFSYDELLNDAPDDGSGQVTSSCLWMTPSADNGNVAYSSLIDGNMNTFYHSDPSGGALNKSWAYLQFDLRRDDVSTINFDMYGRIGSNRATPNNIDVYVSNTPEDEDSWKKVTSLTKGFPGNVEGAYYLSPDIELGGNYRYVRLYVLGTYTSSSYFNIAELQIRNAIADKNKSQYYYVGGLKDACDGLLAIINDVQNKIDNLKAVDLSDTTRIADAVAAVEALVYNPASFTQKVNEALAYVANAEEGTEIGQVDKAAIEELQKAIDDAKASVDFDVVIKAEFETAKAQINKALETFVSKVVTIEPNRWYYIVNNADAATYPETTQKALVAPNANLGNDIAIGNGVNNISTDPIAEVMYEADPFSIWRFVPVEGKEGLYFLQNYATGHYVGQAEQTATRISMTADSSLYKVSYLGRGSMVILGQGSEKAIASNWGIFGSDQGTLITWQPAMMSALGSPIGWKIVPVETEELVVSMTNNYIRSVCYPFEIPAGTFGGSESINPDFHAYGLRNVTIDADNGTSSIELYEIGAEEVVPAGTPLIVSAGDWENNDSENVESIDLVMEMPQGDIVTEPLTVNGLVGTLDGCMLTKAGLGYVANNRLNILEENPASVKLNGCRAWIDPAQVTELTDKVTALTLTGSGVLNGVKTMQAVTSSAKNNNVYTIDGKLLKRNVQSLDAVKGLKKGIYIVGKKKVAVN